ncbi:hypothetical protein NEHOM01_1580 [Nematocida homosporus]|uniref:uncharacterized protein n=1 Tax=Nematocida homosporus TaxID=1912981 RepID=UPI0022209ADE|nr:uncharacterized protein NEHOM01_1580 [Nematocida homosporus]KAI5186612.1 hypothetical protein NEHOM01_1580 [Nematocida homosporus]
MVPTFQSKDWWADWPLIGQTNARLGRAKTDVFDRFVRSVALLEIVGGVLSHELGGLELVVVAGIMAWLYLEKEEIDTEMIVCWGGLHYMLRRSVISEVVFFGLAARIREVSLGVCLRPVAVYALTELVVVLQNRWLWMWWLRSFLLVGVVGGIQAGLIWAGASTNFKRKMFHFAIFAYLWVVPLEVARVQMVGAMTLFSLLPRINAVYSRIFRCEIDRWNLVAGFVSEKDQKQVLSHVWLLCSCFFVVEGVSNHERAWFCLSSVCIVDSVASFFPREKGGHKSLVGSLAGGMVAMVVLQLLGINYPLGLYLLVGAAEYYAGVNDNLLLPVFAYAISGLCHLNNESKAVIN